MNKNMNQTKILATCLTIFMVTVAFLVPTSMAQSTNIATPFTAGPVNPKNGGPLWLQDSNGLALELCLDNGPDPLNPLCFYDPVNPLNPYSVRVGFGPEAFWWLAESSIKDKNNKFSALIVMAAEFAWNNEEPEKGEQFPFTRLRIRVDPIEDGTYKITHPYGVDTFEGKKGERIFVSYDIQMTTIPGKNQGKVGPFLKRIYPTGVQPPVGYISAGLNDIGPITGSPIGTNYFQVNATKLDGTEIDLDSSRSGVQGAWTNQFSVMGKKTTRYGVQVNRADYDTGIFDPGIAVFTSTIAGPVQTINVSGTGIAPTKMTPGLPDPTGTWRNYFTFIVNNALPKSIIVTNTLDPAEDLTCLTGDGFGPSCESSVIRELVDSVTITYAYFYRNTGELEIIAKSTDSNAILTAYADDGTKLGVLTGGVLKIFIDIPPARVSVKSTLGGEDIEPVDVGRCERAGNSLNCLPTK